MRYGVYILLETTFLWPGATKVGYKLSTGLETLSQARPYLFPRIWFSLWFLSGHWFLSTLHQYSWEDERDLVVHVGVPIEQL